MNLEGKVALVTGASTGIGAATAIALAREGADVAVNYLRSKQAAEEVAAQIEKLGRRVSLVQADVKVASEVDAMIEKTVAELGPVDILFNNAGALVARCPVVEMTEELWDEVIALNVKGTFLPTRRVIAGMMERGWGRIINNASVAAQHGGGPGVVAYASAKGAVIGFTRGLAKELAATGVTCNAVAPGLIETPFHDKFTDAEKRKALVQMVPMRRWARPEEVASAVVFLAGKGSSYMTGQTLTIDGGWYMH
ncbi:MAG TPA: 3-oxoacyl-ACP reductase family protein [bacterium]|nr:3-oxoacyl-ACP reductase family protein [bacterium]HQP98975.1 3-oxoacyl-ACP reductase family protein [bacterium]